MRKIAGVVFISLVFVTLAFSTIAFASPQHKKFVLENPAGVPEGCVVHRQSKHITVVSCPDGTGEALGLAEDLEAYTMDSIANTQVNAVQVHALGFDGTGRTVAVLDTGAQCDHPELAGSCVSGWDLVNNDSDASDDNGHGTHVAGIITANGVVSRARGVAPGTVVKAYKVLDSAGSGSFSNIIDAVYKAADSPEVDAISMSLGTSAPYLYRKGNCDGVLPALDTAIGYALSKGKVVVAAAGNSGKNGVSLPGCISTVVAVGAVDFSDRVASFSSRGFAMRDHGVAAPGVGIYSTWIGSSYATLSGTSMATPMVSALVALSRQKNSSTTPALVKSLTFSTAKDLGPLGADNDYGKGRIDALACVNAS